MPWIKTPYGVMHVRMTVRRRKCKACKLRWAEYECDWKVKGKKSGTCDMPLCQLCAFSPAIAKHLCPAHKIAYDNWLKRQREKAQEGKT